MIRQSAVLFLISTLTLGIAACTKKQPAEQPNANNAMMQKPAAPAPSGLSDLKTEDVKVGDGAEAAPGKVVEVNYTGWILNPDGSKGAEFDSSLKPGRGPFKFQLGVGQVIPGWDKGVAGMKVHGKRILSIPSSLAYGERGAGNVIPPNSNLIFEVELLSVG